MTTALRTVPDTFLSHTGHPVDPFDPVASGANSGEIANKTAKGITLWVVGLVPGAGGLLGAMIGPMLDAWWPDGKNDAWEAVKKDVEALVDEKIQDLYADLVENKLAGIKRVAKLYTDAAKRATTSELKKVAREEWRGVRRAIEQDITAFMNQKYAWKVLPYFTTLANIHALLLQELIRNEKDLEWWKEKSDTYDPVDDAKKKLKELLDPPSEWSKSGTGGGTYTRHVKETYEQGIDKCAQKGTHKGYDYQRSMLLMAVDYARDLWPMLKEPGKQWPDKLDYDREVWLGPIGKTGGSGWDNWHKENCYYPKTQEKNAFLSAIRLWRSYKDDEDTDYLCAFQRYNARDGWAPPEGATDGNYKEYDFGSCSPVKIWIAGNTDDSLGALGLWWPKDKRIFYCINRHHSGNCKVRYGNYQMENSWWVTDIRNLNPYLEKWKNSARAVMVGFRRWDPWRPEKPTLKSAHFYRFTAPDTSRVLGLKQYSINPDTAVQASAPDGSASQEWQLQAAPEGLWILVNRYSGQYLVRQHGRCVQDEYPATDPRQALWRLDEPDAHTWTLCSPDGTEGVDAAGHLQADASTFAHWFALPVLDTDEPPVLQVQELSCDSRNSVRLTLTNPFPDTTVCDWSLSFHVPADAGVDPRLTTEDGARLQSATADGRGLLIRLTPGGTDRELAHGETRTFTLSTAPPEDITPSALIPADPRLEGDYRHA
ncbi:insecticidal delta-endotoxin Cry8Ea1 family protein [Streptomyces cyaneogriseus]|nr:insecticidal delta-endotoxin Cry8Ea1 family protein [Streptomyces cyaneogriseus]